MTEQKTPAAVGDPGTFTPVSPARARQLAGLRPWKPGQSGNPGGKSAFYFEALRAAREITPAAVRRLGELAGLFPGPDGEWIPLDRLNVDPRVVEIACLGLIERTLGKPREYDPKEDAPSRIDLLRLSPEQRADLARLLAVARNPAPAGEIEQAPSPAAGGGDDKPAEG